MVARPNCGRILIVKSIAGARVYARGRARAEAVAGHSVGAAARDASTGQRRFDGVALAALVDSATMSSAEDLDERLFGAVQAGDVETARRALADGADAAYVKHERGEGFATEMPVLFVACVQKNHALVELLLAHGADPDACRKDDESWHEKDTCLRAAMPSLELVGLLLENGADPNQPSESGESCRIPTHALDDARENTELIALLVRHGADRDKSPQALAALAQQDEAAAKREQMIATILAQRSGTAVAKRGKRRS